MTMMYGPSAASESFCSFSSCRVHTARCTHMGLFLNLDVQPHCCVTIIIKIPTNDFFHVTLLPSLVCAHHSMYIMYLFSGLLEDCRFVLNQKFKFVYGRTCPPQSFVFVVAILRYTLKYLVSL